MNDQVLDWRKYARIVWRHKRFLGVAALIGLLAGVAFTLLRPPMLTSRALVVLPSAATKYIGTHVVIAGSNPVLEGALPRVDPPVSLTTLRDRVQVRSLTPSVIAISAEGTSAAQAEDTANAVAASYIAYVRSPGNPVGPVKVLVLQGATTATGTPLPMRMAVMGGV